MIDERSLVDSILNGENLNPYHMRSYCILLTRYYYENGVTHHKDIRKLIFEWANKYGVYVKLSLKDLIHNELFNYKPLSKEKIVKISSYDIDKINSISNKKNTKKLALAILCYAKVFSNENIFDVNIRLLCDWIGMDLSNVYNRQLKELIEKKYVIDLEDVEKWNGKKNGKKIIKYTRKLYINHDLQNNDGIYILIGNNFLKLYSEIKWR